MPISADGLRATLTSYLEEHPEDADSLYPVLGHFEHAEDPTSRKQLPAHATASAVALNSAGQVLHIRHRALDTWLRPGGHLEVEDSDLAAAALRELVEETGIEPGEVALAHPRPIHVDCHPIPANPAKGEPDHLHVDFRFLFTTDAEANNLQVEEVTGAAWLELEAVDAVLRSRIDQAALV